MSNRLPIPAELAHLIEKREGEERRLQSKSDDCQASDEPDQRPAGDAAPQRRSGEDRRAPATDTP